MKNVQHGGKGTKLYEVWCTMRRRCNSHNAQNYERYGGRGIKVCEEWNSDFRKFRKWAFENGYKEGLSIDRVNNNGNYEPSNCRWATHKQQSNNQSDTLRITYKGKTKTLHEWADILSIKPHTLYYRVYRAKWDLDRAFSEKASFNKHDRVRNEKTQFLKGA